MIIKKVVHISTVHSAFDSRIFYRELSSLSNYGFDLFYIVQHQHVEVKNGVKIIPLPKVNNRFYRLLYLNLKAFSYALLQKADIYHFHDPEFIPMGLLLKFIRPSCVIYDVHEDYPEHMRYKTWLPKYLRLVFKYVMIFLEKMGARYFDAIVTPTRLLSKKFLVWGAKRVVTLKNLPNLSQLFIRTDIEELSKKNKKCFYDVVHLGSLSMPRLEFMLKVAHLLYNWGLKTRWLLIGVNKDIQKDAKNLLMEQYPELSSLFDLISYVSYEDIINYLSKCKIGINHHFAESRFMVAIPAKVFDYMAAGLPIVTSDLPLLREMIESANCAIFVEPGNLEAFAKSIRYLLENPDEALAMGLRGSSFIGKYCNWEKENEKLINLYLVLQK